MSTDTPAPMGAIINGQIHADRLEITGLECEAGPLTFCNDWVEFRRCFNHLAEWATHAASPQPTAAQPLHITHIVDWLAARYRAAGGKAGITDLSAFVEETVRWTEAQHGIGASAAPTQAVAELVEALRALVVLFGPVARDSTQKDWIEKAEAALSRAPGAGMLNVLLCGAQGPERK